ncbi:MAG TPA: S8 family serine peptidase, partial [Thermoanaerobaculia bacterium]|nr:S8 family serine peptidase [Thermoanaerobaculia bacterium]
MTPSLSPGYRSTRFVSATRPSRICSLLILSFLSAAILAPAPLRAAVRFRFVVDPGLAPFQSGVERRSDGLRRRLAAIREPGGRVENFVVNEVVFQPQGAQDLTRFLQRYNGVVVDDGGIPDLPGPFVVGSSQLQEGDGVVVVRVDLGRAHVSNLATNATALGASGRFAFSSPGAVQLAAIIAAERVAGAAIGIDLVGPPTGVTKPCLFKTTHEEPTDPAAPDQALPNLGFQDGFKLNWLNDPDIEVAASWQYVAHNGHAGDVVYLAMIDGGFVPNQDFRAADLQWDFVHNRRDATGTNPGRCSAVGDCPYHGTATFSTAGAVVNNRFGAAGTGGQVVTPFLFKVDYSFSQVRRAVRAAVKWSQQLGHPAVINMSFGGSCGFFCWEQGLDDALTEAVKAGLVPVAAAGNHNKDAESEDFDPCTNSAVICVGAISPSRRRSSFSNYGGAVHIWAPGEDVETTPNPDPAIAPGDLPSFAGTSVAAPFVAGIVASMLALDPFLNRDSVLKILQETARPSSDLKVKPGYVDALRALRRTGLTDRVSSHFAGTGIVWHDFFAAEDEVPLVGDFNGDCRSDVVTFRKNDGAVFVALSDGTQFVGRGVQWLAAFCMGDEVCVV